MPRRNYDMDVEAAAADRVSRLVDRFGQSHLLTPVVIICLLGIVGIWSLVLASPSTISWIFDILTSDTESASGIAWLVIFGLPFVLTFMMVYSIARSRHPDIEKESEIESGMMAGYAYRQRSDNRWRIWMMAGMAGALNCLLLFVLYNLRS